MDYFIICLSAFFVSILTFFSGFGLGTLLMPAFAVFFPLPVAVAATAVVHLVNNLFKIILVGRMVNKKVILRFAVPALGAAFVGAWLLIFMSELPVIVRYQLGNKVHDVTLTEIIIGVIIVLFALMELMPRFEKINFSQKYLPLGGILSGFFGGLSGHQGALRAMFLVRAGLGKEEFIGTSVVSAVIVDFARLFVYGAGFYSKGDAILLNREGLILSAVLFAFLGSWTGKKALKNITYKTIQVIVGVMLVIIGTTIAVGLI